MLAHPLIAIAIGAVLGAWLRYGLGLWLNPVFAAMPLGTLAANLIGRFVSRPVLTKVALSLAKETRRE